MAAVQEMGEPNAQTEIVRPSLEDLRRLTIPQLRAEAVNQGISLTGLRSKTLIVDTVFQGITALQNPQPYTMPLTIQLAGQGGGFGVQTIQVEHGTTEFTIEQLWSYKIPDLRVLARELGVYPTGTKDRHVRIIASEVHRRGVLATNDIVLLDNDVFWTLIKKSRLELNTMATDIGLEFRRSAPAIEIARTLAMNEDFDIRYTGMQIYQMRIAELTVLGQSINAIIPGRIGLAEIRRSVIERLIEDNRIPEHEGRMVIDPDFYSLESIGSSRLARLVQIYGISSGRSRYAMAASLYQNGILHRDIGIIRDTRRINRRDAPFTRGTPENPRGVIQDDDPEIREYIEGDEDRIREQILEQQREAQRQAELEELMRRRREFVGDDLDDEDVDWGEKPDHHNIYNHLTRQQILQVIEDRDVDIKGDVDIIRASLRTLDEIEPYWITEVIGMTYDQLEVTSMGKILARAANAGIELLHTSLSKRVLLDTIKVLEQTLNIISREDMWYAAKINDSHSGKYAPKRKTFAEIIEDVSVHRMIPLKENLADDPKNYYSDLSHPKFQTLDKWKTKESVFNILLNIFYYPLVIPATKYLELWKIGSHSIYKITEIVTRGDIRGALMRESEQIWILSRGRVPQLKMGSAVERYELFRKASPEIKRLLINLYPSETSTTRPLVFAARANPLPIEKFILAIESQSFETLSKAVGMHRPPSALDVEMYFYENILDYRNVAARLNVRLPSVDNKDTLTSEFLSQFQDIELFNALGVYIYYESRDQLIDSLVDTVENDNFFVPTKRRPRNEETTFLTPTDDTTVFMVAYGTLSNYVCYELDELNGAFRFSQENGGPRSFKFDRPDDMKQPFTITQVRQLNVLLGIYPELTETLRKKIAEGIDDQVEKTQYDQDILRTFAAIPTKNQLTIHDYLIELFNAGMYMRRWKGPGMPYPVKQSDTSTNTNPDPTTVKSLQKMTEHLDQLTPTSRKFLTGHENEEAHRRRINRRHQGHGNIRPTQNTWEGGLRSVEFTGKTFRQSRTPIGWYINEVGDSEYCIRMASTVFIGTAFYYLRLLFHERIPDFDPEGVDQIM